MIGQLFHGIDSETAAGDPVLPLVGELMTSADVTQRMIRLAQALVGHLRGGPGAGRDAVQHVLRRHLRLLGRRRRGAEPHRRARDGQGALRPRLHRGADRLGLDDRQPDPALDHGGGLRRDRQRVDRRAVPRAASCRA